MNKMPDRWFLRLRSLALTMALAAAMMPAMGKALHERDWLEARSPNFIVISSVGKKSTVSLVRDLEDFRQLVGMFTNAARLEPRVPTLIFVFPDAAEDFGLVYPVAGRFHPHMRANYAAVRAIPGMSTSYIVQHEYVHFLVRNQGRQAYPRWYDEGLAEVLGMAELRNGSFDLGADTTGRTNILISSAAWMPYERLIDDEQTQDLSLTDMQRFYAQSWALVHYLNWGKPGFNVTEGLKSYLAEREQGTPAVAAFERAFGENPGKLTRTVKRYLTKHARGFKGTFKQPFDAGQVQVRRMPRDEAAAMLGGYLLMTGHAREAAPYVDAALATNPRNARALVYQADLHKYAGRFAEAEALYPQAIALEPGNHLHHLDFGEYWLDRARGAEDGEAHRRFLSKARQELVQAHKLDGHHPETLAVYGSSFLFDGEDPAKGLETLEYAHQLLPSEPVIKLWLAELYVELARDADARPLLRAIIAWEHDGQASATRALLAQLDERQQPAADVSLPVQ